jgi:hypothetical protein
MQLLGYQTTPETRSQQGYRYAAAAIEAPLRQKIGPPRPSSAGLPLLALRSASPISAAVEHADSQTRTVARVNDAPMMTPLSSKEFNDAGA